MVDFWINEFVKENKRRLIWGSCFMTVLSNEQSNEQSNEKSRNFGQNPSIITFFILQRVDFHRLKTPLSKLLNIPSLHLKTGNILSILLNLWKYLLIYHGVSLQYLCNTCAISVQYLCNRLFCVCWDNSIYKLCNTKTTHSNQWPQNFIVGKYTTA